MAKTFTFLSEVNFSRGKLCTLFPTMMLCFISFFNLQTIFTLFFHPSRCDHTWVLSLSLCILSLHSHIVVTIVLCSGLDDKEGVVTGFPGGGVDGSSSGFYGSSRSSPRSHSSQNYDMGPGPNERFSRKVFVGGLPPDIDEGNILMTLQKLTNVTSSQMRSQHPSADLDPWWWTGLTRLRASHTFRRRDTPSFFSR